MSNLVTIVKESINNAEKDLSKLTQPILELDGMSSPKVRHFLNNIINNNSIYLEIGCWRGSTFISALWKNNPQIAYAIDDWSEFNDFNSIDGLMAIVSHEHAKDVFYYNIKNFIESNNIIVVEEDCFTIDINERKINNIDVYFYDGCHNLESQYNALKYYYNALSDRFIFIVDDWNWNSVQQGTKDSIKDLNLKILFEQEMPADYNGDTEKWWNGLYIAVLNKTRIST